jgi:hypothetical protein
MTARNKTTLLANMDSNLPGKGVMGSYYRAIIELRTLLTDILDSIPNEVSEPTVKTRSLSLAHDSDASIDIGDALPAGSQVVGYASRIDTTFNGTAPTIEVGDAVTSDAVMADTVLDLTGAADTGASSLIVPVEYAAATQLVGTYAADGSTAGAAKIIVFYV